ncbi:hypothetical protein GCM10023206_24820 [Acinetobacter puyangensis]|uniref:Uncharacterized protein n=1 Tax=Acinetobacter puyangensis TaxID=1096779 RepID=A0A240E6A7_9GAMM|nr:hypothetical protein [Acinetobacter puyangensis]SNX43749.1 hypothetical protein SAMN05421731_101793 [Acinetobacter puyangensis]
MFKIIPILSIGLIMGLTACQDRKNHDPVNEPETTTPHTLHEENSNDAGTPNVQAPVHNSDAPRAGEVADEVSPTALGDTTTTGTTSTNSTP